MLMFRLLQVFESVTIKGLVDEHNIIVPTGTLNPAADVTGRKRGLELDDASGSSSPRTKAADSRRPGRAREGKRSKNRGASSGGQGGAASSVVKSSMQDNARGDGNGAWEALVSVCSML